MKLHVIGMLFFAALLSAPAQAEIERRPGSAEEATVELRVANEAAWQARVTMQDASKAHRTRIGESPSPAEARLGAALLRAALEARYAAELSRVASIELEKDYSVGLIMTRHAREALDKALASIESTWALAGGDEAVQDALASARAEFAYAVDSLDNVLTAPDPTENRVSEARLPAER